MNHLRSRTGVDFAKITAVQIEIFDLRSAGLNISVNLCMSPCSSDYIFNSIDLTRRRVAWRIVSEDPSFDWLKSHSKSVSC